MRDALQAPDVLSSADGVGFSDEFNRPGTTSVVQSDGDQHRPLLKGLIGERIKSLVGRGPFDAIAKIARLLPTAAISALVGLPEDGRASMLDWAVANCNAVGPQREGAERDFEVLAGWRTYQAGLQWESIREGSWARMPGKGDRMSDGSAGRNGDVQRFDVLVVGAGHAGAHAAMSLRQLGFAGTVALLSDEPD